MKSGAAASFIAGIVLGEFYEKFKDRSPDEIRQVSFEQGLRLGQKIAEEINIKTDSIENIAALLSVVLKHSPTAKIVQVDRDKVLLRNSGFCPLMVAATSLDLPWLHLLVELKIHPKGFCEVLEWPFFHGLASAVNPKIDLRMTSRRSKGDPHCDHLFAKGEGRLILP